MKTVFGTFEVEGCILTEGNCVEVVENDSDAEFFSTYFRTIDGIAICQRDFQTREMAEIYARNCMYRYPRTMTMCNSQIDSRFWRKISVLCETEEFEKRKVGFL